MSAYYYNYILTKVMYNTFKIDFLIFLKLDYNPAYLLSSSPQGYIKGNSYFATSVGIDLVVWSSDNQQRNYILCLALYHLQHTPGLVIQTALFSDTINLDEKWVHDSSMEH